LPEHSIYHKIEKSSEKLKKDVLTNFESYLIIIKSPDGVDKEMAE
jgi:hypothetical protein